MFYFWNIFYWIIEFGSYNITGYYNELAIITQTLCIIGISLSRFSNEFMRKSVLTTYFLFIFYCLISNILLLPYSLVFLEIPLFMFLLNYQLSKSYDIKSDEISKDTVCFAFYKPKTIIQFILSLFGCPVSSATLIIGDDWYRLSRRYSHPFKTSILNIFPKIQDYIIIDTGVKITEEIKESSKIIPYNNLRDKHSLYFRSNCVRVLKPVLDVMPEIWHLHFLDWNPAIYLSRRLKWTEKK